MLGLLLWRIGFWLRMGLRLWRLVLGILVFLGKYRSMSRIKLDMIIHLPAKMILSSLGSAIIINLKI